MRIKGNAWLARCDAMEKSFGADAWRAFLDRHVEAFTFLRTPVMTISRIDAGEFLSLHELLVEHFFDGDTRAWWTLGVDSGVWAMQHQLRGLFSAGENRRFLAFTPRIYRSYFDGGELEVHEAPAHVDLRIYGVPTPHVYFEYSVMGFAQGGLKMLETELKPECLRGFSRGDDEVRYRFAVTA